MCVLHSQLTAHTSLSDSKAQPAPSAVQPALCDFCYQAPSLASEPVKFFSGLQSMYWKNNGGKVSQY